MEIYRLSNEYKGEDRTYGEWLYDIAVMERIRIEKLRELYQVEEMANDHQVKA